MVKREKKKENKMAAILSFLLYGEWQVIYLANRINNALSWGKTLLRTAVLIIAAVFLYEELQLLVKSVRLTFVYVLSLP